MTIRGGGDPTNSMGLRAALQNGPAARSLAADAHGCIMVPPRPGSTEYKIRSALRAHLRGVKMGSTARWL
jgi:hypothetical protein